MNSKPTRHSIDTLFTFLLLLSFLLFSLLVAGTGSMVYQNGTDSLNKNYYLPDGALLSGRKAAAA